MMINNNGNNDDNTTDAPEPTPAHDAAPVELMPIPVGAYRARCEQVSRSHSKMGDFLRVDFRIADGPHVGRVLSDQRFFCTVVDPARAKSVGQLLKALHAADLKAGGETAERVVREATIRATPVQLHVDWEGFDGAMCDPECAEWQERDKATLRGEAEFKEVGSNGARFALGVRGQWIWPSAVVTRVEAVEVPPSAPHVAQSTAASDTGVDADAPEMTPLVALGIRNYRQLVRLTKGAQPPWLVQSLLRAGSVNAAAGDSGLGKTPLLVQLGLCVAGGVPFLGMATTAGSVLYCDAETGEFELLKMVETISRFLGLPDPPEHFHVWSPYGSAPLREKKRDALINCVRALRPALVIIDPKRAFWGDGENKNEEHAEMVDAMRRVTGEYGCTWLILHHVRKRNRDAMNAPTTLTEDPRGWFQEVAGGMSFINHTDTRLGIEPAMKGAADLIFGGFMRIYGTIDAVPLSRTRDDNGDPLGYKVLTGLSQLAPPHQEAYRKLPSAFRFKDAKVVVGGNSDSQTNTFLQTLVRMQIIKRDLGGYVKLVTE